MATTIKLKNGSGAPLAADLVQGEPAFDLTNKRLYTENASGTVIEIGTSPSTIDINAGTIDGTVIGGATPAAGTFTTLTANGNVVLGDAATDTVTVTADVASNLIPSADNTYDLGASGSEWKDLYIDGTANIDSLVADTADINGGTIDGVTIGGASAGAGTFTQVNFGDNAKAVFGAGSDLQIYHDGSASLITESGTGNLKIQGSNIEFLSATGEDYANFLANGAVRLYYDNSTKLATTATGIDVTGTVTADGLTVNDTIRLDNEDTTVSAGDVLGDIEFYDNDGGSTGAGVTSKIEAKAFSTYGASNLNFYTSGSSGGARTALTQRMQIDGNGDISFYEDTGTTPKLFWDASAEALGIGTSSPATALDVSGVGGISAEGSDSFTVNKVVEAGQASMYGDANNTHFSHNVYYDSGWKSSSNAVHGQLIFDSSGNFKIRHEGASVTGTAITWDDLVTVTSNGNVGIGTTSIPSTSVPHLKVDSNSFLADNGLTSLSHNAYWNSGWKYNATAAAALYQMSGDEHYWYSKASGTAGTNVSFSERMRIDSSGMILPGADDAQDLGSLTKRYDDVYATNALIQTSDRNEKQDIEALSEAEQRVAVAAKGLLRKFRWKSKVAEKGDDARIHFGIIAQDLQAAFEAEGLDAGRYAMFIHSTWTDEETGEERSRMGVRYSELLAFIISAI